MPWPWVAPKKTLDRWIAHGGWIRHPDLNRVIFPPRYGKVRLDRRTRRQSNGSGSRKIAGIREEDRRKSIKLVPRIEYRGNQFRSLQREKIVCTGSQYRKPEIPGSQGPQ